MANVGVVTDSVACLSGTVRAQLGIGLVGVHLILDGVDHRDGIDLTAERFYARMPEVGEHRTATPSPGEWLAEMRRMVDEGADALLAVTLTSTLSGTFDSARIAAAEAPVPAAAVDSRTAAAAEGLLVRRIAEEARAGATLDQLTRRAEAIRGRYHLEFVLGGLERLAATGRMPRTMARLGDVVEAKPVVTLSGAGHIRTRGVVHGLDRGMQRLERRALEVFALGRPGRLAVSHALLADQAEVLAAAIRQARPDLEVSLVVFSPVMGASAGQLIGIAWEDPGLAAS